MTNKLKEKEDPKQNWGDIERLLDGVMSDETFADKTYFELIDCYTKKFKAYIKQNFISKEEVEENYVEKNDVFYGMTFNSDDYISKKEVREMIEEIPDRKFPRGERKWCIECANRIRKDLLNKLTIK